MRRTNRFAILIVAALLALPTEGRGQTIQAMPEARQSVPGGSTEAKPEEQASAGLWDRANLFGDAGGTRSALAARGITLGLQETSEVLGNLSGGTRRALVYEGVTQLGLGIDLGKAIGLTGGTFNVSAFQIHGRGLSQNALGNNLHTVSSLEALRGTLLFELWYEQALFNDKVAVRVGQLAADQEFMVSRYASLFLNHTFGWSSHPSADLPFGGPSYPLATPGVRLRVTPREDLTLLAGLFNGDPAGPGSGQPQLRDASGTAFRLNDGVFAIFEAQLGTEIAGLAGTYKLGGWYNSQRFEEQRRDLAGQSLADPATLDLHGRQVRGNWALYGVADQLVWTRPGSKDAGLGVFARAMGAPGDRNLINFYLDAGVTYKGARPGRDDDTAGLAVGYARYSDTASKSDSDNRTLSGTDYPIRRTETVLEATYQAQIAPWWQVQPSAQYVFNLNGGVLDPRRPGKRLGDAAVLILRTNVSF